MSLVVALVMAFAWYYGYGRENVKAVQYCLAECKLLLFIY